MIVASLKPLDEVISPLKGRSRVLVAGCAGCTAVCMAGGQREVDELVIVLRSRLKDEGTEVLRGYTVERQCETQFVAEMDSHVRGTDAIVSLACGAGVQFMAERYPEIPVYPALNTLFTGVKRDPGWYEENCRSCGDCQLARTGGICPVTRCAKSIFNGPCGGSERGMCEANPGAQCAWCAIYERLKGQGRPEEMLVYREPVAWRNQVARSLVVERFADRQRKN